MSTATTSGSARRSSTAIGCWRTTSAVSASPSMPSTLLEGASAGEPCYAVVLQTWLCHHFFPTQFLLCEPITSIILDRAASRYWLADRHLYRWETHLSVQHCSHVWSKALILIEASFPMRHSKVLWSPRIGDSLMVRTYPERRSNPVVRAHPKRPHCPANAPRCISSRFRPESHLHFQKPR